MKLKSFFFIFMIIIIILSIYFFESTKPDIDTSKIDADIQLDSSLKNTSEIIKFKSENYELAKELIEPEGFINIENLTLADYIGEKVILIDFWTYSCINCQRTLPYLNSWHEKYSDDGLLIIGVHTPEFEFEKDYENVLKATTKWNINYPIVQDNDRQIWRAYQNRYWPRKYLIDIDGFIVYDHIGEGGYEETETKIQELLKERKKRLELDNKINDEISVFESDKGTRTGRTPELYFGYKFSKDQLGNQEGLVNDMIVNYTLPNVTQNHLFYLEGSWKSNSDNFELKSGEGMITLDYYARSVNLVAGSKKPVPIEIFLDGEKINDLIVEEFDLYNLISSEESGNHSLKIKSRNDLMVYSFTFG